MRHHEEDPLKGTTPARSPHRRPSPPAVPVQARRIADDDWKWSFQGPASRTEEEQERETLCTLGNGVFALRGAALDVRRGAGHYPGTYAAGCFNSTRSRIAGQGVDAEALVNLPNPLPLRCRVQDGDRLTPDTARILDHHQELDLRHGLLRRSYRLQDREGRHTRFEEVRLVHMARPHLAAVRLTVTAENWSGTLLIDSEIDTDVLNTQVERYRAFDGRHLTGIETGSEPDGGHGDGSRPVNWVSCHTTTTSLAVVVATRTHATADGKASVRGVEPFAAQDGRAVFGCEMSPGRTVTVDKTIVLRVARLLSLDHLRSLAVREVRGAPAFPTLLRDHRAAWNRLWSQVPDTGPPAERRTRRLYRFHLLQVMSPHSRTQDVGVPSRGLHGEEYQGRIFWDEAPVLDWLGRHFPQTARAALDYRSRRLPAACRAASEEGLTGALYPWQSGHDGREATVPWVLNPLNGRWAPDHTRLQRHVGASLAHCVFRYARTTGDQSYLQGRGADMVLQIARYWAAAARHDPEDDRYHIHEVMGPDEYHDAYPDARTPGLKDNAYTNVLVSTVLLRATALWGTLPPVRREELERSGNITEDEPERWLDVSRRLAVPFHDAVVSQFAGYAELPPLPWDACRERYGDLSRLDRLLDTEDDHPRNYQVAKQPDTLALGWLFTPARLAAAFAHLGYALDADTWRRTVEYYLERTTHGSTLSAPLHAHVLASIGHPAAERFRRRALSVDHRGDGNAVYGIHLGAMAAALDLTDHREGTP
ncbi:glycoside hydrolase family 65 protein [Streptomyces sp. NPDC055607]